MWRMQEAMERGLVVAFTGQFMIPGRDKGGKVHLRHVQPDGAHGDLVDVNSPAGQRLHAMQLWFR